MQINISRTSLTKTAGSAIGKTALVSLAALALSACSMDHPGSTGHVAGWTMIDATQRHPIIVSEQPANLSIRVARGSQGLNPHQRANLAHFLGRYRGTDNGNDRLTISVPSGSPNEISALRAVEDVRAIVRDYGIDDSRVAVNAYHSDREQQPPLRISYNRFVAEAPECGSWPTNVGDDTRNLPYPNLGCATQRNLALQVANPADLLVPRTMTPASSERRDEKWEKFKKGDVVVSKKDGEEKASTKSQN
jgi:pilus assembly protein CpaD